MNIPESRRVLIIGTGLAGIRAAHCLRQRGHTGHLSLIGTEDIAPYDRPPLSKELFTRTEPAWLQHELGIDAAAITDQLQLGCTAQGLSWDGKQWTVITTRGEQHADDVILAMGSSPSVPWPSVRTLHTPDDAQWLRHHHAGRIAIIGAGWIAGELAGVLTEHGAAVTVLEAAPTPLFAQLGLEVGSRIPQWYSEAGVTIHAGTSVTQVHCRGQESLIQASPQFAITADLVIAATGNRAATAWLPEQLPRGHSGAIPTSPEGQVLDTTGTVVPGLWAAGDCTYRADRRFGPIPPGHWSAALHDPDLLAAAILHQDPPPEMTPFLSSVYLGHQLLVHGVPSPDLAVTFREPAASGPGWQSIHHTIPTHDGQVTIYGIVTVDQPRRAGAARKLLAHGPLTLTISELAALG